MIRYHQTASRVAPASTVEELTRVLLAAARQTTRRSSDRVAKMVRKELGRANTRRPSVRDVVLVLFTALEDGAPLADVLAFPAALQAAIEAKAIERTRSMAITDLFAAIDRVSDEETIVEGRVNCSQHRVARDKSPDALRQLDRDAVEQIGRLTEMRNLANRARFASAAPA